MVYGALHLLLACSVLCSPVSSSEPIGCKHDYSSTPTFHSSEVNYEGHPFATSSASVAPKEGGVRKGNGPRRRTTQAFQSLRMKAIFDDSLISSSINGDMRDYLENDLVPAGITWVQRHLSVMPVTGALTISRQCPSYWVTSPPVCAEISATAICGSPTDPSSPQIPEALFHDTRVCSECWGDACNGAGSKCETVAGGSGEPDTDYVLLVTSVETALCGGGTVAYAGACATDQYDRPVVGHVNLCPSSLDRSSSAWDQQLSTVIHEISHALGFSSQHLPYFRAPDGSPLTPRDSSGLPIITANYACPSGITQNVAVPSSDTLTVETKRGGPVVYLSTATVKAVVREHFNCPTLPGAELENQPTSSGVCFGSHWERRLFPTEYMTSHQYISPVFSTLTLAFFKDSGWYEVDLEQGEPLKWGAGLGCDFSHDECLLPDPGDPSAAPDNPFPDHFCTDDSTQGCTQDRLALGYCDIATYSQPLPTRYQYFSSDTLGGSVAQADFCPMWTPYGNGDCRDVSNQPVKNFLGEQYSAASRCLQTSLRQVINGYFKPQGDGSGCFQLRCNTDSRTVAITVSSKTGQFHEVECSQEEQQLSVPDFTGTLTCPPYDMVCGAEALCPAGCSGRGVCMSDGMCQCSPGFRGDDCSEQVCPEDCGSFGSCNIELEECKCLAGRTGQECELLCAASCSTCDPADASVCLSCPALHTLRSGRCVSSLNSVVVARLQLTGASQDSFDAAQQEAFLMVMKGLIGVEIDNVAFDSIGAARRRLLGAQAQAQIVKLDVVFTVEVPADEAEAMADRLTSVAVGDDSGLLLSRLSDAGIDVTAVALGGPVVVEVPSQESYSPHAGGGVNSPWGSPGSLVVCMVAGLWWVGAAINDVLP